MATSTVIENSRSIAEKEHLYRALNPRHHGGLPGDNHFVMRQNCPEHGVSTGLASLISIGELRSIEALEDSYGPSFGVAELVVSEVLAPVAVLGITVLQEEAPEWGAFAGAHAVITGYHNLLGNEGRRQIRDFQRHLVTLAQKRYYAPGSETLTAASL